MAEGHRGVRECVENVPFSPRVFCLQIDYLHKCMVI